MEARLAILSVFLLLVSSASCQLTTAEDVTPDLTAVLGPLIGPATIPLSVVCPDCVASSSAASDSAPLALESAPVMVTHTINLASIIKSAEAKANSTAPKASTTTTPKSSTGASTASSTGNCATGSVYSLRLKKCVVCSAGTYADQKLQTCRTCTAGYWQDQKGAAFCKPCLAGTYHPFRGATKCLPCPWPTTSKTAAASCSLKV